MLKLQSPIFLLESALGRWFLHLPLDGLATAFCVFFTYVTYSPSKDISALPGIHTLERIVSCFKFISCEENLQGPCKGPFSPSFFSIFYFPYLKQ